MVVIAGDVPSYYYGRHPHQEVNLHQDADQFQIYRPFCKRVYRVDRAADLPRIVERAFHLAQTGRPGPVLVDVPMDMFSADLPSDAFQQVPAEIARPALDPATAARIVAMLAEARPAGALRRRRRAVGRARASELAALAEALRGSGRAHADGQGLPARRSSAAARHDRLLGHADRQRHVPDRRSDPRRRHAARRGELELVGSALHVRDSADAADSHRRRPRGDRPQLPDRARRRRRRQAGARRACRGRATVARTAIAVACRTRFAAGGAPSPRTGRISGPPTSSRCGPSASSASCGRPLPEDGFIVTDVGWNKNGVGQQFPITVPGTFITPSGLATMGFGAGGGARRQDRRSRSAPRLRWSATAGSAPTRR